MYNLQQITNDPLQSQEITLPDGSAFELTLYFIPMQYCWLIQSLVYGSPVQTTGTTVAGSNQIASLGSLSGILVGQTISAVGITSGTKVTAIGDTTITMSAPATAGKVAGAVAFLNNGDFILQGVRISVSPNILHQWRNQIPFGIGCTCSGREPTQQNDFASGAANLYLLTQQEVNQYAEFLSGGSSG